MARPQPFQSLTYPWQPSTTIPIDLSFLNATRDFNSPITDEIIIVADVVGDTGQAGLRGGALASMFSQVLCQDQAGIRANVRGSSLRVIDQVEYMAGFQDPTSIAPNQAAVSRRLILRIPFNPHKARRRADFGLPIRGFIDGGKLRLSTSPALVPGMGAGGFTITSGQVTVYAIVRDEEGKEGKSRRVYEDEAIQVTNYDYNVAGSLVYALWYNGELNEAGPTPWAPQQLTSKTLELQLIDDFVYQDWYTSENLPPRSSPGTPTVPDVYAQTDSVLTGQSVPVYFPYMLQKIPDNPLMQTLNVRTTLAGITTSDLPQLIKCYITERSASVTARVLGVSDPAQAVATKGRLKAANGKMLGVASYPAEIAKMMPVKITAPGQG